MTDPVLGHSMVLIDRLPSGWKVRCECGERFHGITRLQALDRWGTHMHQARDQRATGE